MFIVVFLHHITPTDTFIYSALDKGYCGYNMSGKTIKLTLPVYDKLEEIRKRNGHQTFDSVVRYLLMKAGELE